MISHKISGYADFRKFMDSLDCKNKIVNILFSAPWCPDCVVAAPNIKEALEKFAPDDSIYIYVDVGDRETWKDIKCSFRTDKDTHLSVIPSFIRWKQPMRIEGEQCDKMDLLEMFLTED